MIFELVRIEMSGFGLDDVGSQLQHVLGNLLVLDLVEILVLLANLVRVSQRHPEQAFAARLERDDVLARGENDSPERHHAFVADRLANDRERLLADLAVGYHVVGIVEIEVVDLFPRHELVDLDGARALDRNRLELLGLELDVLAFADFVTLDDVGGIHLVFGLRVHFAVFDAVAGLLVDLVKPNFLSLAAGRKQRDRTRNERELEVQYARGATELLLSMSGRYVNGS